MLMAANSCGFYIVKVPATQLKQQSKKMTLDILLHQLEYYEISFWEEPETMAFQRCLLYNSLPFVSFLAARSRLNSKQVLINSVLSFPSVQFPQFSYLLPQLGLVVQQSLLS